jgi:alpha-galactosidase
VQKYEGLGAVDLMSRRRFLAGIAATGTGIRLPANRGAAASLPATLPGNQAGSGSRISYVHAGAGRKSWTIGNDLIEREIHFADDVGLRSVAWRHKVTGSDFLERARKEQQWGNEFSMQVNGIALAGAVPPASYWKSAPVATFVLVDHEVQALPLGGQRLELKLKATTQPLDLSVFYAVYDGHPVVRKWLAITNKGERAVTVSHLVFEAVELAAGSPYELELCAFYGIRPVEIFYTGRSEDPAIVQRNARTGEGLIVMNEAPGSMKRTETGGWGQGAFAVMYDTDLCPFERTLQPGERFTSAKASIAAFVEGRGFSDPCWVMPSYTSKIIKRTGAAWQPLWIYNSWEPLHHEIDLKSMTDSATAAVRMGLDIFDLDEGWEVRFGENEVNQNKFPGGLGSLRDLLERGGARMGLDQPLAVVETAAPIAREHPEWQRKNQHGQPIFARVSDPVMCLASAYREHAARRLGELISQHHLKFVQIDLTTNFDAYGGEVGCWAENHDHRSWPESLIRCYEGIEYVLNRLHQEHPEVVLDLTFECWGNYKHGIDYAHIAMADLDYLSNVDDTSAGAPGPVGARTLLYERALAVPTENLDIGNILASRSPLEERFATVIGASPLLNGDLRKLTTAQQDWWRGKTQWFKKLRQAVPMNEGFFPLGAWRQPNLREWDGFARLSREGEGIVAIFANESGIRNVELRLPVFPDGQFTVRSELSKRAIGKFSGTDLRHGITLKLPSELTVDLIEVRRVAPET